MYSKGTGKPLYDKVPGEFSTQHDFMTNFVVISEICPYTTCNFLKYGHSNYHYIHVVKR